MMSKCSVALFVVLLLATACKKEYAAYPYNAIESFVMADISGSLLKASIVDNDIIVYWPPLQTVPDSIAPVIIVSDRAVVQPASGVKVAFSEHTTYKVTAQDGSVRTFTLRPAVNQAPITFSDLQDGRLQIGVSLDLLGEYYITDTSRTQLYLLNDKKNTSRQLYLSQATLFTYSRISIPIPADGTVDTGYYHVRLLSGVRSVTKGPYYMDRPYITDPAFVFPAGGTTLHRGEEIIVTYNGSAYGAEYWNGTFTYADMIVNGTEGNKAEVLSQSPGTIRLRIPDDMRTGTVDLVLLYSDPLITGGVSSMPLFHAEDPAKYITIAE